MTIIDLFIPCIPAGQPRTRSTIRGKHSAIYQPQTRKASTGQTLPTQAVEMRHAIRESVRAALPSGHELLEGPLQVDMQFWFPRPGKPLKTKPNPPRWHIAKPDRDNIDKAVLDCLTGLVWHDDNQCCGGWISKAIVAPGKQPGVMIRVSRLLNVPEYPVAS